MLALLLGFMAFASESPVLKVGDEAPDFTLPSNTGEPVALSSYRGKKSVVLYFYPKDNTPGCTTQAQKFRDDNDRYAKAGAVVLGVSVDDETSHKFFANKHQLNFPLLADVGGKVARQYGVMGWIMAKRVTFLIDPEGKITQIFDDVDVQTHSSTVLKHIVPVAAKSTPRTKPVKRRQN
jgi:peroxiredoxin Q/BCP